MGTYKIDTKDSCISCGVYLPAPTDVRTCICCQYTFCESCMKADFSCCDGCSEMVCSECTHGYPDHDGTLGPTFCTGCANLS